MINGGFFVFEREFVDRYLDDRDDIMLEGGSRYSGWPRTES
jgi:hypothetical protein